MYCQGNAGVSSECCQGAVGILLGHHLDITMLLWEL